MPSGITKDGRGHHMSKLSAQNIANPIIGLVASRNAV